MGSVRTSILRRPRPLPPHRRADHPEVSSYTLDWEEPLNQPVGSVHLAAGRGGGRRRDQPEVGAGRRDQSGVEGRRASAES